MNYPTLQVTDFLNNPKHVSDLAESLEYIKSEGGYPGSRTKPLHEIDPDLSSAGDELEVTKSWLHRLEKLFPKY